MKLPPWLWRVFASRRTRIALLCSPFVLMIGLVVFYAFMNWWGPRQFEKTVSELRAEGFAVTLDDAFGSFPDDQDILKHPAVIAELERPETERLQAIRYLPGSGFSTDSKFWKCTPDRDTRPDVTKWAEPARPGESEAEVARHLLGLIKSPSDRFKGMKEAFARPQARWSEDKDAGSISRVMRFSRLPQFGGQLASLELAAGDTDAAASDVLMVAEVITGLGRRNTAISYLVVVAGNQSLCETIWQGIDRGAWSDSQLQSFEAALQRLDLQNAAVTTLEFELAYTTSQIRGSREFLYEIRKQHAWPTLGKSLLQESLQGNGKGVSEVLKAAWRKGRPIGSDYLNMEHYLRMLKTRGIYRGTVRRTGFSPEDVKKFAASASSRYDELDASDLLRTMGEKALMAETRRNLLRCGIALERHRLKYGTTPEKLEAVVPEFLTAIPLDVCDQQPLRYQRLPDGSPHVWSLWPSGKDEGGMPRQGNEKGNAVWTTGAIPGLTDAVYKR